MLGKNALSMVPDGTESYRALILCHIQTQKGTGDRQARMQLLADIEMVIAETVLDGADRGSRTTGWLADMFPEKESCPVPPYSGMPRDSNDWVAALSKMDLTLPRDPVEFRTLVTARNAASGKRTATSATTMIISAAVVSFTVFDVLNSGPSAAWFPGLIQRASRSKMTR